MINIPNWCRNTLTIKLRDKKQKDNFIQLLSDLKYGEKKIKLDFNNYIPYPQKFKDMDKEAEEHNKIVGTLHYKANGFNSGGYEWCCENWGTKWNVGAVELVQDVSELGKIVIEFDTAWCPPGPIFIAMAKKYTGVEFRLRYTVEGYNTRNPMIIFYYKDDKNER
jgi:hypothetical protein